MKSRDRRWRRAVRRPWQRNVMMWLLGLALLGSLVASTAPALADVYSIGVVAVATGGENVNASLLAVSNSGNASTYQGIALSATGNADGTFFAASGTGCARAPWFVVAVSGTGCAEAPVAVSGAGPVGYNNPATGQGGLVSVSGTNCAKATHVAIGGGCAQSSGVTVAGTGTATNGLVAVSGTGNATNAYGGAAVSGTGRADGTGTNVSGEAYLTLTGLLNGPVTPEQAELAAQGLVVQDPSALAAKLAVLADTATYVAQNMALNAGPPEGMAAESSENATSSSGPPPAMALNTPFYSQSRWYYCVPAVTQMYMDAWGLSGYSQDSWAATVKTKHAQNNNDKAAGTPIESTIKVINDRRRHPDYVYFFEMEEPAQLMYRITTDAYNYGHGLLLSIKTTSASWWSFKGSPDAQHAILVHGYDHRNSGSLYIMDPYDYTKFNWDERSWGGPNPGGSKKISLGRVWSASEAAGAKMVW